MSREHTKWQAAAARRLAVGGILIACLAVLAVVPAQLDFEPDPKSATASASPSSQTKQIAGSRAVGGAGSLAAAGGARRLGESAAKAAQAASVKVTSLTPNCAKVKCVALTFDDGPNQNTATVLDALKTARVPGTFFVVGSSAQAWPDLLKRTAREGHQLANHTWSHPYLTKITSAEIADQINRTSQFITQVTGQRPDMVRPTYGALNANVVGTLKNLGQAIILWNVDTEDWRNRDTKITTDRALAGAKPGSIILFHDVHPTAGQALPGIIGKLKAQGYTFVTVRDLLAPTSQAGVAYRARDLVNN